MYSKEDTSKAVEGVTVEQAIIGIQIVDRLLRANAITGTELTTVGHFRDAMIRSVETATGKNYDAEFQKMLVEQQRAAAEAEKAAGEAPKAKTKAPKTAGAKS